MIFSEFTSLADLTNKLIEDREESIKDLSENEERWRSLTESSPGERPHPSNNSRGPKRTL